MAPYHVEEVHTREQLDAVVELIWEAQYRPYMSSASIFFPVDGFELADRERGIAASKERLWNELQTKKGTSQWISVVDETTSQPVGAAMWHVYPNSPAPDGFPKLNMDWLKAGEMKDFCEETYQQILLPRSLWMTRPHGGLTNMVVHPDYRHMGIGGMTMAWGNRHLDKQGIEGFIEGSEAGSKLYEKWGYITVMKLDTFIPSNKPIVWNKLANDLGIPRHYGYIMWRPVSGKLEPGGRQRPWQ